MKDKLEPPVSAERMAQARQLLAQGESLGALLLALDALVQSLNHLRGALDSLQQNLAHRAGLPGPALVSQEEPEANLYPLPERKPLVFH
jgi:hypothetical protein